MDGSRRSAKSNAFFTGFGKRKKIALYDNLIEQQTTEELVAVLAHEIGHFKRKHIVQRMVLSVVQMGVIFFLIGLVVDPYNAFSEQLYPAFGIPLERANPHHGLVLFMLLFKPVSLLLGVAMNAWSRKHEFEADAYAAEVQGTPAHLITALKKLSADNLSNLTPTDSASSSTTPTPPSPNVSPPCKNSPDSVREIPQYRTRNSHPSLPFINGHSLISSKLPHSDHRPPCILLPQLATPKCPNRKCGKWGLKLPAISLGFWHNFGDHDDLDEGRRIMHRAFDRGITHFDFANNYGPPYGSAERNCGQILKKDFTSHRDELLIASKAGHDMWAGPYGEWGSRKYLLASLDQSLARLQLDYVDIFLLPPPRPPTPPSRKP